MSETAQDRRSRRGGGRDARRQLRSNSSATVTPFISRQVEPLDILNNESAEIIENNAEVILEEIGIDEYLSELKSVSIFEWPKNGKATLPSPDFHVQISYKNVDQINKRELSIS